MRTQSERHILMILDSSVALPPATIRAAMKAKGWTHSTKRIAVALRKLELNDEIRSIKIRLDDRRKRSVSCYSKVCGGM